MMRFFYLLVAGIIAPFIIIVLVISGFMVASNLRLFSEAVAISGTGSMYPTFPKGMSDDPKLQAKEIVGRPGMLPYPNGINIFGKKFFNHEIGHGDIVLFISNKTKEETKKQYGRSTGLVKRAIALPGDSIEIRDGLVYLNDKFLPEPYIARARSTFGGEFLPDCKRLVIPQGKLFVMGDNRKGSGDSRQDVGLIDYRDVTHVLPLEKQKGVLDRAWRNTSRDQSADLIIRLNKIKYLEILNQKRRAKGVPELKYESRLEASAQKRAAVILRYNDYSFEATRSGYTMQKAMNESGYSNIIYGEVPTPGHFEAEELTDTQFEFPKFEKFLLDPDYQEIGIADYTTQVNGCSTNIVVQHLAGYIPPDYDREDIEGWSQALSKLKEIQPSWQKLKESKEFYEENKKDVDRVNEIIQERISNIESIVISMQANKWLTKTQIDYSKRDESLAREQVEIAERLNAK